MHISKIELTDWKVYQRAVFDFPAPDDDKNIVLIGAPNGYGKTSLFEAIVLCLFGRPGLSLIARAPLSNAETRSLSTNYSSFLEKSLHKGARIAGRNRCSVKLCFVDDDDEEVEIERVWHFKKDGVYNINRDEDVYIRRGLTRKSIAPDPLVADRMAWFSDYIATNFLPVMHARFFMFDGEQVGELAEREMSKQVSMSIEGLLGLDVLNRLADDLRKYADSEKRSHPQTSDEDIGELERERDSLTAMRNQKLEELSRINLTRESLERERTSLQREFINYGDGALISLAEQLEKITECRKSVDAKEEKLEKLMTGEMALALAGRGLRNDVKARLQGEDVRENWESKKSQEDKNFQRFLASVDSDVKEIDPALSLGQRESVSQSVHRAWDKLWHAPPEGCAEKYLHVYLKGAERSKVIDRLNELEAMGKADILDLLNAIEREKEDLKRHTEERNRAERISPYVEEKKKRSREINGDIERLDKDIGALKRDVEMRKGEVDHKNAALQRLLGQADQSAPAIRRASRAYKVAEIIDKIVLKAVPNQIDAIANSMTKAHRSMARKKGLVEKISIDEKCDVKFLGSDGEDLRDYDLSAGEKQIFTQALISAVSSVSGHSFPMIVDTPLGRLDEEHRKGVLNHLAQRGRQVILLSTDTEVVGPYLQEIEPHVQAKYLVDFEKIGDAGTSTVRPGYFERASS